MALSAQLAADVQTVADKITLIKDKIRECRCAGDGSTAMVVFIDESSPYEDMDTFDMDALAYEDAGITATVAFDVADDGDEKSIYPSGGVLPAGVSVHSCSRPPVLAELTAAVSANIPGSPSRIVVAVDSSGSMNRATIEPTLTDFIDWLHTNYSDSDVEVKLMGNEKWLLWAGELGLEDCSCRSTGPEGFPYEDNAGRLLLSASRAAALHAEIMELASDHFWEQYYAYQDALADDPEDPQCPVWCPSAQCRLIADSGTGAMVPPSPGAVEADTWINSADALLDYMLGLFPEDGSCPPLCNCTGVPPEYMLSVRSEGPLDSEGAAMSVSISGDPGGSTPYTKTGMADGYEVSLSAPEKIEGFDSSGEEGYWLFDRWSGDFSSETTSIEFDMPTYDVGVTAVYVFSPDDPDDPEDPYRNWRCYVSRTWVFACTEDNAVRVIHTTSSTCLEKGAGDTWYGNYSDGSTKVISYRMETSARCPCNHSNMVARMNRSGPSVADAAARAGFDGCGDTGMRCWHTYVVTLTCDSETGDLVAGPQRYQQGWLYPGPAAQITFCLPDELMQDYLTEGHVEPNYIIRDYSDGSRERDYVMEDKCVYPGDLLVILIHQSGWPCRPAGF